MKIDISDSYEPKRSKIDSNSDKNNNFFTNGPEIGYL